MFAFAVVVCFVLGVVMKSRRRDERMVVQQSPLPPSKVSFDRASRRVDAALGREILHLLEEGRRADALALVREQTGWGAEEAEEAVKRLENLMKRVGL
jgi:hypothetical protein